MNRIYPHEERTLAKLLNPFRSALCCIAKSK
jgi:hypothetical protein